MQDPAVALRFLFQVFQYGGIIITALAVFLFIKSGKDKDPESRENSLWVGLAGVSAYLLGSWLAGTPFPTI